MDKWEKYIEAAQAAGCPSDQVRNFIKGGYIATPKALEFHAAARLADANGGPVQVAIGGARGGGKSHCQFAQIVFDDAVRAPGIKSLFLRKVGKAAKESFEDLIRKVCPQHLGNYISGVLRLPNDGRVLIGGFRTEREIDNYLGIEYDSITIEENNLITYEKHRMIRGSLRSSRPDWRARLYSNFNPGGIGHGWVKRTFIEPWQNGKETDTRFIFATYRDNPFIDDTYKAYLEGLTGWLGRAWRDGDWDIAAGQYFTNWNRAAVVKEFEVGRWRYWLAMDYGFTHYTVVYLLGQDGDGHVYFVDEHAARKMLPGQHAAAIRAMLRRHKIQQGSIEKFVAGADVFARREDSSIADQYKMLGLKLEPAQMDRISGAGEWLRRLGDVMHDVRPTVTIHPRCARLIESIPQMQHDPRRPEDVLKVDVDEEGNGGDDFYDAARYGLMETARKHNKPGAKRYA